MFVTKRDNLLILRIIRTSESQLKYFELLSSKIKNNILIVQINKYSIELQ